MLAGGPRTERFTGELCRRHPLRMEATVRLRRRHPFDTLATRWSKHPLSFCFLVRRLHPQMHLPATNGSGMVPASAEHGAQWHAASKGLSQMHYAYA